MDLLTKAITFGLDKNGSPAWQKVKNVLNTAKRTQSINDLIKGDENGNV